MAWLQTYFLKYKATVIMQITCHKSITKPCVVYNKMLHVVMQNAITSGGSIYIKGLYPKDPENPKIFSGAMVLPGKGMAGYIYVILGNKEYRNVTQMIFSSQITGFTA